MATTIQIRKNIKDALDKLKGNEKDTYEDVIIEMMRLLEEKKRGDVELMMEGIKEMYGDYLEISKEWQTTIKDGLDEGEKWKEF